MIIGLYAKHAGLIDLLAEIWHTLGHEVHLSPKWPNFRSPWEGNEDLIVSTLPYDMESLETGKPTVVYYTDPTWPALQKNVQNLFDEKRIRVIGAEDCYMPEHFPDGVTQFIPFALNPKNYPIYSGDAKEVIIVNRKPHERWKECIRGATGVGMTLDDYLEGIPYRIIQEESVGTFRKQYARSRVLFYFSNSPYTIVLFEAMQVGIPIVAFNHHHLAKSHPIEKYLRTGKCFYSTDRDQIREKLQEYLETPERVTYPFLPNFDQVCRQWQLLFDKMMEGKKYEKI